MEENVNVDEVTKIISEYWERIGEAVDEQIKEFLESETTEHAMHNEVSKLWQKNQ